MTPADSGREAAAPSDASPSVSPPPDGGRRLDPDALAALEEERDFLLRSLEDLEEERRAGDVDDDDYQALVDDYTARAAAVIAAIEGHRSRLAEARSNRSPTKLVAWVALVVLVAGGIGWWVASASGSRAPGDTISGDVRASTIGEIARANQLTALANQLIAEGRGDEAVVAYQEAIEAYDRALELQPAHVEAMTYRGWLLHNIALRAPEATAAELDARALEWLDRAISADPGYADARIFRALMLRHDRPVEALADLDTVAPAAVPPAMREMVEALRQQVAEAAGAAVAAGGD